DYFYAINHEDSANTDKLHIVEINLKNGEKKILTTVDSIPALEKSGNVLYINFDGKIRAFDTEKEEDLWEIEADISLSYPTVHATDNAVVYLGDEGFVVYYKSDGEKMYEYEAETYMRTMGVDGEDFYVTEESDETK